MKRSKIIVVVLSVLMLFAAVSCNPEPEAPSCKGTFYGWDSNDPGLWVNTGVNAVANEYDLEISFDNGTVSLVVDGSEIYNYDLTTTSSRVSEIILQSLNNGKEYTVQWTLPTLNDTPVSDTGWVVDRAEPKEFDISGGEVTITTTDANVEDFYRFQGKKIVLSNTVADKWSVKTKLSFDGALLNQKGFAPSIWLNIVDGSDDALDWAIIQLQSDAK